MARGFTEQEKQTIKSKLISECEKCWIKYGYKKTSINDICTNVGIAKGSFYLFFDSKEAIFVETLCVVTNHMYIITEEILKNSPNKQGFTQALKQMYFEYNKRLFISDVNSSDFLAFTNKLSQEQINTIEKSSRSGGQLLFNKPYLHFLIDKNEAASIIMSLLSINSIKERLAYDDFEVFSFMLDNLIDKILE